MADWLIHARNSAFQQVAEIHDYQSLEMVQRFNNVGTWLLELPADSAAAGLLDDAGAAVGIVATRGGITEFSGVIDELLWVWSGDQYTLQVSGYDDNAFLANAIAHPSPADGNFATQAYDVRTAAAETAIKQYVDNNIGPSALTARRVGGLTVEATTGLGSSVTGRARLQNLLTLCQDLALAGGDIGFRIVQDGAGIEFQAYSPEDKSAEILFSPDIGNLEGYTYRKKRAEANYFFGGGGGAGTARTFVERFDSASITAAGRKERFRDRRDTTSSTEIAQTLEEELDDKAEKTSLEIAPIDTEAFSFFDDYGLGDRVTCTLVDGTEIQQVIREVQIVLNSDGEKVRPQLGSPNPKAVLDSLDRLNALEERVDHLEVAP